MSKNQPYSEMVNRKKGGVALKTKNKSRTNILDGIEANETALGMIADIPASEQVATKEEQAVPEEKTKKSQDAASKPASDAVAKKTDKRLSKSAASSQKDSAAKKPVTLYNIKEENPRLQRSYYIERKFVPVIDDIAGGGRVRSDFVNDALRNFILNHFPEHAKNISHEFTVPIGEVLPFDKSKWKQEESASDDYNFVPKKRSESTFNRSYYIEEKIIETVESIVGGGSSGRSNVLNQAIREYILTYFEEFADRIDKESPFKL